MTPDSAIPTAPETPNHAELELDQKHFSEYLLHSRSEILFLLRSVLQKKCMLTVYFDGGRSFFLTSLLSISDDGNWLYFDVSNDQVINRNALAASKLMFTTMLERVKIQFSIGGIQEVPAGTRKAFAGELPTTLLRLQRRQHFRLSTPIATPIKCNLSAPKPDGSHAELSLTLLDISGGGVGLMVPDNLTDLFKAGNVYSGCQIDLPNEGKVVTGLCVRNSFPVSTKSGTHFTRVGCEFVELPGAHLNWVQRYITRVERERKAREAGLE
jgi:c-di-GMP-binding flagellar brake protein YcgR